MWTLFVAVFAASTVIWIARYLTKPSTMALGKGRAFVGLRQGFALCALVLLWAGFSRPSYAADLSAAEILGKVSDTYRHLKSCRFIALKSSELVAIGEGRTQGGIAVPNFYNYPATRVELAAVMPTGVRLEVKIAGHDGVVVSDGQTTWTYLPKAKLYKEAPGGISEATDPFTEHLAENWQLIFGRFRDVSQLAASATREKDESVEVGGDKVECYVVKLRTPDAEHELWVDMNRFLVLRFQQIPLSPRPGPPYHTTVTVNMVEADLNPNLQGSLFRFTPPKGSRIVSYFDPSVE